MNKLETTPSRDDLTRFLRCFDILCEFDSLQRLVRGYGAGFDPQEWPDAPDPVIRRVVEWLSSLRDAA